MKKKIIKYGLLIIFLFIIFQGVYFFTVRNKTLLKKTVVIKDVKFSHVKIKEIDDGYMYSVYVDSKGDNENLDNFDAIIRNKKGDILTTLNGKVGGLKKGQYKYIEIETKDDLSKAYSVSYTIYRK